MTIWMSLMGMEERHSMFHTVSRLSDRPSEAGNPTCSRCVKLGDAYGKKSPENRPSSWWRFFH